jgi:hypothetical protein
MEQTPQEVIVSQPHNAPHKLELALPHLYLEWNQSHTEACCLGNKLNEGHLVSPGISTNLE